MVFEFFFNIFVCDLEKVFKNWSQIDDILDHYSILVVGKRDFLGHRGNFDTTFIFRKSGILLLEWESIILEFFIIDNPKSSGWDWEIWLRVRFGVRCMVRFKVRFEVRFGLRKFLRSKTIFALKISDRKMFVALNFF